MNAPTFVNETLLDFDAAKFYSLIHDHPLCEYSESDRTQWLEVLKGIGGGVSSAWTHVFVYRLLQIKHSLLNYALAEGVSQSAPLTVLGAIKVIDAMINASGDEWLIVLSVDTSTFESLKASHLEMLNLIPHLQSEKFLMEWDARRLSKTVNVLVAKFQSLLKKQQMAK